MATTKRKPKNSLKSDPMFANFKRIEGMTDNQDDMIESFRQGLNVVAVGSAGTGKTYVAMALALEAIADGRATKIVLIRSAVATRDIGFLPGTEAEKMAVYEQAFSGIVNELLGRGDAYQLLKQKGVIEFHSSSFLRGNTWKNCIVVADEIQNFTPHEMNTIMTRAGEGTTYVMCGDIKQTDLGKAKSGFWLLDTVARRMPDFFDTITFTRNDIVRSEFVKEWIIACEDHSDFYNT